MEAADTTAPPADPMRVVTLTCPHCGKQFAGHRSTSGVQSNYKRHLLVHSHERPHRCRYCAAGFTTRSNMKRHVRARHPELASPRPAARPPQKQAPIAVPTTSITPQAFRRTAERSTPKAGPEAKQCSPPQTPQGDATSSHHPPASPGADHLTLRAIPPFALPSSTKVNPQGLASPSVTVAEEDSPPCCHRCGRFFAFNATRLLHEESCDGGPPCTAVARAQPPDTSSSDSDSQEVGPSVSASVARLPATVTPPRTSFVCKDCELEVSSRTRLRRHQHYYCPFRTNILSDPLTDVVARAEGLHEEAVGRQLSAQTGLRFYRDANCSDGSSAEESEESTDGSEESTDGSEEQRFRQFQRMRQQQRRRRPRDGAVPPTGPAGSARFSAWALCSDETCESLPARRDAWPEERLHLDYHRRRSSHKRQRRILRRRLQAQEQQQQLQQIDHANPTFNMTYSAHLCRQAEATAGGRSLHARIMCPFDGCLQVFANRRHWLAHVIRCHPDVDAKGAL